MQKRILFKNAKIAFTDQGKGKTVVLIHGFLENATMWNSMTTELSKKNRIITIDLLGHGASESIGYLHSMELFAETIAAVLKYLKIRKCVLVGHSLGGYVALAYADMFTEKVKGICLINSTSYKDSDERKAIRTRANKMAQSNLEGLISMSISNLFLRENTLQFKEEIDEVRNEALQTTLQGYIAASEGMKLRPDRSAVLLEGSFKKLCILGEKDPVLDFETCLKEAELTGANVVKVSGGHMSHIENKDEVLEALKDFVKKCS